MAVATVRYRLFFRVDQCLGARPMDRDRVRWDVCMYFEGDKRPVRLVDQRWTVLRTHSSWQDRARALRTPGGIDDPWCDLRGELRRPP